MNKNIILIIILSFLFSCSSKSIKQNEKTINTEHFVIYYYDSNDYTEMCSVLENQYSNILSNLAIVKIDVTPIYIYPDKKEFHKAIMRRNAPSWVVGTAKNNVISIVSPYNAADTHSYDDMLKVVVHEFVHIAVSEINNSIPRWLNEGIASFEAKQMYGKRIETVQRLIFNNELPDFYEIEKSFGDVSSPYQVSYTLVEYIIYQYGYAFLLRIIKQPCYFEKILDIDKDVFNENWKLFVEKKYG